MRDTVKRYTKSDLTVVWQPGLCIHSQICFHGLPAVFDPRKRPWVNLEGAEGAAIVAQVRRCPSGALSLSGPEVEPSRAPGPEAQRETAKAPAPVSIEPQPNGPLLVRGDVEVRLADGNVERRQGSCTLCRCGQSSNKPFCDGTHARVGFQG